MTFESSIEQALSRIPKLDSLGNSIAAPFPARRFANARVLWVNHRWFLGNGIDTLDPKLLIATHRWLLDRCAFGVPRVQRWSTPEGADFYLAEERSFHADRYGAPGGTPMHGGSGRCGFSGSLNVKGIGMTPLISPNADWYHSHGCLWLEEAIRETVCAEVAAEEFPFGVVPILAIIVIDDKVTRADGSTEPPRALLVRPNFVRPAHFERSTIFGNGGSTESPQYQDACRTKDAIRRYSEHCEGHSSLNLSTSSIHETFDRLSIQIGFGWSHRLFHGGYYSSNVSVDGELTDFGSFRALPNWCRAYSVRGAPPFGSEIDSLEMMLNSLSYFFKRFASVEQVIAISKVKTKALQALAKATFHSECESALGLEEIAGDMLIELRSLLQEHYQKQQETLVSYVSGAPEKRNASPFDVRTSWIATKNRAEETGLIARLERYYMNGVRENSQKDVRVHLNTLSAVRWLKPRPWLFRESLLRTVNAKIDSLHTMEAPDLEQVVARIVGASRRVWRHLPSRYAVLSQALGTHSAALHCVETASLRSCLAIEASRYDDRIFVFGKTIRISELLKTSSSILHLDERACLFVVETARLDPSKRHRVDLAGASFYVPRAQVTYSRSC